MLLRHATFSGRSLGASAAEVRSSNLKTANVILLVGIALLTVGYMLMNSRAGMKGFVIKSYGQRILDLKDESKKLDLQTFENRSMGNIEAAAKEFGFEPVTRPDYLNVTGGAVAVR